MCFTCSHKRNQRKRRQNDHFYGDPVTRWEMGWDKNEVLCWFANGNFGGKKHDLREKILIMEGHDKYVVSV